MMNDSSVAQFFAEAQKSMELKFRGWEKDIKHPGEKGGIRERRVTDFVSSILPRKYGIGTGHIISPVEPFTSFQTDIVIYDALNGIKLQVDDYYSLFPCECVYVAIEVKSKLTASNGPKGPSGSIYECLKSTTRLKSLSRERHNLPPIYSYVFAYEVGRAKNREEYVKEQFESLGRNYSLKLPELVFVLAPGFVCTKPPSPGRNAYDDKGMLTDLYTKNPLFFFISHLVFRLSGIQLKAPTNLWDDYINWQRGDIILKRDGSEIREVGVEIVEGATMHDWMKIISQKSR